LGDADVRRFEDVLSRVRLRRWKRIYKALFAGGQTEANEKAASDRDSRGGFSDLEVRDP
jgi:hypothetical protein